MEELDLKMEQEDVKNYTAHSKHGRGTWQYRTESKVGGDGRPNESAHARDLRRI
jgi:hypothetical protein